MKEKFLIYKEFIKHNKKIILTSISCIFILAGLISGGLYLKYQNDVRNYKKFCYNYIKLDEKISNNEKSYSNYIKAIKNYVDVFTLYEGYAKISDENKNNIVKVAEEYIEYISELKNLSTPKEFKEEYDKLIDLYDKDIIRRENINRDFKNNNGKNIEKDYIEDNKDLIQMRNDFKSKITIITKQKGMNIDNIILELEKESK